MNTVLKIYELIRFFFGPILKKQNMFGKYVKCHTDFKGLLNCLITFLFSNGFERMRAFWESEVMYDNQMTLDFQSKV